MKKTNLTRDERIALSTGDIEVFNKLFRLYFSKIRRFLSGFMEKSSEVEDLAQDVFVKIWVNRTTFAAVDNVNAYIYRIAKHILFDHIEQTFYKQSVPIESLSEVVSQNVSEEEFIVKEMEDLINLTVQKMPLQRKKIFLLSRKEGLKNQEIAEQLNISKRTVETHISAALTDIRKTLQLFFLFF